jgi:CBS domain-containing protein
VFRGSDMTNVGDVMNTTLVTAEPNSTVAEAATIMGERHVGSTLVMQDGRLVGIFTERDIVRALSQDFDAPGHPISHWMTKDPRTIAKDATVEEALEIMFAGGFRHLPVAHGDELLGMVSMRDLSRATAERAE